MSKSLATPADFQDWLQHRAPYECVGLSGGGGFSPVEQFARIWVPGMERCKMTLTRVRFNADGEWSWLPAWAAAFHGVMAARCRVPASGVVARQAQRYLALVLESEPMAHQVAP